MILLVLVPMILALGLAGLAGVLTWRRAPVSWLLLGGMALLELLVIVQLIVGAIALAQTTRPIEGVVWICYLIGCVVVPPVAALWGLSDRSRWGTGVIAIGGVTVAVLCLRLISIWG